MEHLDHAVGSALGKCAAEIRTGRPGEWRLDLGNGVPLPARAWLRDRWLELAAPLAPAARDGAHWALLQLNGALPGPARIVDGRAGLALRADVPLHDAAAIADRILRACDAVRRWHAALDGDLPAPAEGQPLSEEERAQWIRNAADFGWGIASRPDGRLAASLPVPGRFGQASVATSNGAALLTVRLAKSEPLEAAAVEALGAFLLRSTGSLRMVRASVRRDPDQPPAAARVVFEVALPRLADGVELDAALSALTVACRHCGREARALTDVRLARAYLDHTHKEAGHAVR